MVIDKSLDDVIKQNKRKSKNNRGKNRGGNNNRGNRNFIKAGSLGRNQRNFNQRNQNGFRNQYRGGRNGNYNGNAIRGNRAGSFNGFSRKFRNNKNLSVRNNKFEKFQNQFFKNSKNGQNVNNFRRRFRSENFNRRGRNFNGYIRNRGRFVGKARQDRFDRRSDKNPNRIPLRAKLNMKKILAVKQQPIPAQLHIENLHFKVSEKDMKELFSEFGKVSRIALHFDRDGKPQGTCDINYVNRSDAIRALKRYNDVPLDGRPMKIKIIGDIPKQTNSPVQKRITNAPRKNLLASLKAKKSLRNAQARQSVNRSMNKRKLVVRKRTESKSKPVGKDKKNSLTEEMLDKELDAYLSKSVI